MEVRKDAKGMNGDGHTSQRVPWQPLDLPTRIAPPTGKTDDLQGPTCGQNGHSCRNNLALEAFHHVMLKNIEIKDTLFLQKQVLKTF